MENFKSFGGQTVIPFEEGLNTITLQHTTYVPNEKARLQINNKVSRKNKKIDGLENKIKQLREIKAYFKKENKEKGDKIAEHEEV